MYEITIVENWTDDTLYDNSHKIENSIIKKLPYVRERVRCVVRKQILFNIRTTALASLTEVDHHY